MSPGLRPADWSARSIRLTGVAAFIGGVTFPMWSFVEDVFAPTIVGEPTGLFLTLPSLGWAVASFLFLVAVGGVHAWASDRSGRLGTAGSAVTGIAFASLCIALFVMGTGLQDLRYFFPLLLFFVRFLGVGLGDSRLDARLLGGRLLEIQRFRNYNRYRRLDLQSGHSVPRFSGLRLSLLQVHPRLLESV